MTDCKYSILASTLPGKANVGEILLAEMLHSLPENSLELFSYLEPGYREVDSQDGLPGIQRFEMPIQFQKQQKSLVSRARKIIQRYFRDERSTIASANRMIAAGIGANQKTLWYILNSHSIVDLAWHLSQKLPNRCIVQIWDAPEHLLTQSNIDRFTQKRTLTRFLSLLNKADKVAVIGETMQREYGKYSKKPPIIIRHGVDRPTLSTETTAAKDSKFRIGFCGSMYALSAWRAFLKGLDVLNWDLGGKSIEVFVVGNSIQLDAMRPANVRFFGWQSPSSVVEILDQCDLLYIPQDFGQSGRALTTLSFPTKLSSYVATGKPVFVHTPAYGSLAEFCQTHRFGILHSTLDPDFISSSLRNALETEGELLRVAESTRHVANTILSKTAFRSSLHEFASK